MMKKLFYVAIVAWLLLSCSDYNAPANPNAKNGALSGEFSVSLNEKVHFSQGNLQYMMDSHTWRFAPNQYDVIGLANFDNCKSGSGAIDAFAWGTGNNPTFHDSINAASFVDWGVNKILNGGNVSNAWRTLTTDEWGYIFWERPNAQILFGHAIVAGVNGLIVLPDNWSLPGDLTFVPSTTAGLPELDSPYQKSYFDDKKKDYFSYNLYTKEEWLKMEKAGAVFLPAAGVFMYDIAQNIPFLIVDDPDVKGMYWSATPDEHDEQYSYDMDFLKNALNPYSKYNYRWNHCSVRLVQ